MKYGAIRREGETWKAEAERVKPPRLSGLGRLVLRDVDDRQARTGRGHHVVEAFPFVRSGAAILLPTPPRVAAPTVAFLAPAMTWSVQCEILVVISLTLFLGQNTVESVEHYKIWFGPSKDICERSTESGFFIYDIHHVLFNKTSRRILDRTTSSSPYRTNYMTGYYRWHGKWKWETPEVGVGLYLSFRHLNSDMRRNDNPTTNPRQLEPNFRGDLPDTGKGSDFSAFFKGNPLFPQAEFYDRDTNEIIKRFTGTKCGQTGAWIANEGYYKWDERSNE